MSAMFISHQPAWRSSRLCTKHLHHTHHQIGIHRHYTCCCSRLMCAASRPQPCIVLTSTSTTSDRSLHELAERVRQQLPVEAVVVTPAPAAASGSSTSTNSAGRSATAAAHLLSFDRQLHIVPQSQPGMYHVVGATTADCVLCAVDGKAGLLAGLGLSAALVVVGVHRGHALGSDVDINPAVCVARHAAQMGIPSVAACLATHSTAAPLQPAVEATFHLIQQAVKCLKASNSSWPLPANYPRAHFPFPDAGRWALGKELPLPQRSCSSTHGSSAWQPMDCWALGEDNSWVGRSGRVKQTVPVESSRSSRSTEEAVGILQRAFADGDILLCLNVPPTWQPSNSGLSKQQPPRFASTRPGVLWHCYQVQAEGSQPASQQQPCGASPVVQEAVVVSQPPETLARVAHSEEQHSGQGSHVGRWEAAGLRLRTPDNNKGSSNSGSSYASWHSTTADLYGRSLPGTSFMASQAVVTGAFVAQDNTDKVIAAARTVGYHQQQQSDQIPSSFVIKRGTLLNDHATAGDVEAVFSGRAAVNTLQTWPMGHPLSLTDSVLCAALEEDHSGLPAWLTCTGENAAYWTGVDC